MNLAFWLTCTIALFWYFAPQNLATHWLLLWSVLIGLVVSILWAVVSAALDILRPPRRPWWREEVEEWHGRRWPR